MKRPQPQSTTQGGGTRRAPRGSDWSTAWLTCASVRREKSFRDVPDLARRAGLGRAELRSLAAASALLTLAGNRHQSYWAALGIEESWAVGASSMPEAEPLLAVPTEGENLVADYASLGFTLGRHPLALLRRQLERHRVIPVEALRTLPHNAPIRIAGLVTHRRRPESANGVTLEDETGHINTIVWPKLGEYQRKTLIGARLLGMVRKLQRDGDVVQVIASKLQDYSTLLGRLRLASRDFK